MVSANDAQLPDSARIAFWHALLGIPPEHCLARRLPLQREATVLAEAGRNPFGRSQRLHPDALARWQAMQAAARDDGVTLLLVSGFRDAAEQAAIFQRKLQAGQPLSEILQVNAPPGYSEHHTGMALDIGTLGCESLMPAFEATPAFAWLARQAGHFGFCLSYPRGNPYGFLYEPWHWVVQEERRCEEGKPGISRPSL